MTACVQFISVTLPPSQTNANLEEMLGNRLAQMPPPPFSQQQGVAGAGAGVPMLRLPPDEPATSALSLLQGNGRPASPVPDDWEIDITQLQIDAKVASGAFSNLYRGSYCGQEVAVKILKDVQDDTSQYQEFLQVESSLFLS